MKINLIKLSILLLHLLGAQTKPVSGYVINTLGKPLSNVNITSNPSKSGTQTDQDGRFYFLIPVTDSQLLFQYIGYEDSKINVVLFKNKSKIILKETIIELDSLVVEEKKIKQFNSDKEKNSVFYIDSEDLTKKGATDLADGIYFDQSIILNETITGQKTISLRGSSSNELSIFYDGIQINRIGDPMMDLSVFPTSSIKGIEILKGSHESAISSSGSINLIPNVVFGNNISLKQQFGTYDYGGYDGVGSLSFRNISANYGISESQYSQSYTDTTTSDINTLVQRDYLNVGYKNGDNLNLKLLTYNHKKYFNNYRSEDSISFKSYAYIFKLSQYNLLQSNIFLYGMYQNQEGLENLKILTRSKVSENREFGFELFKKIKNADIKISSQASFLKFEWDIPEGKVVTERQNSILTGSFELNKPDQEDKFILKDLKLVLSNHRITDQTDTSKSIEIPYQFWENNNFHFTMSFMKKTVQRRIFYYTNFTTSFRSPSLYESLSSYTNNVLNTTEKLDPEQKSAFELGYKINRNLEEGESSYNLNTSFFFYSYLNKMKNIIISGTPSQFIVNSGKAKIFGFDAKLKLNPSVNWIGFQFLISNYFYSDPLSFPLQPDKVFKNIITLNTKWINIDLINRNEGKKVLSSILSDGTIVENSLKPNIGFDCTIFKKFNYKFLKFSISLSGKNLLSKETSISGISIYDKRYYFSINVKI